jgi:hypothetical protein
VIFTLPQPTLLTPLLLRLAFVWPGLLWSVNMAVVHALDDYYLAITLLITIAYQLFFFSIAFSLQFDKLTGKASPLNISSPPSQNPF